MRLNCGVGDDSWRSPLDCEKIQLVHSEGDRPWVFFGRNDVKAETPVLWPPHVKSWLIGKDSDAGRDWEQEEKGTTEGEMAGWHRWLDGRESEWTPGVDDGQGGLACFYSWGHKESDTTEPLNWTNTVKGFSLVSEADVLLDFSCFFYNPMDVGNLISRSFARSKSSLYSTSGSSQFISCWSLTWRILSITLLACEMSTTVQ